MLPYAHVEMSWWDVEFYSLSLLSYSQSFIVIHHHFLSLVEETLEPLDPDRRAFRLVGGVLVSIF